MLSRLSLIVYCYCQPFCVVTFWSRRPISWHTMDCAGWMLPSLITSCVPSLGTITFLLYTSIKYSLVPVCLCVYISVGTCVCVCVCTYVCTCTCVCVCCLSVCLYVCVCKYVLVSRGQTAFFYFSLEWQKRVYSHHSSWHFWKFLCNTKYVLVFKQCSKHPNTMLYCILKCCMCCVMPTIIQRLWEGKWELYSFRILIIKHVWP